MTPSRFNSRWMYAQSGRTRSCAGAARRNNRASSTASSSSAGSGQPNPRCAVLCRYSETVPTPMAQAWAIARWDNPRSCLRRRTSRIFLTSSLRAGIASPSFRKAKRAVIRLPTSVHDDRNGCSTSPDSVFNIPDLLFNFPGFSVHLPPDWAFKILRITQSNGRESDDGNLTTRPAAVLPCPGGTGRGELADADPSSEDERCRAQPARRAVDELEAGPMTTEAWMLPVARGGLASC